MIGSDVRDEFYPGQNPIGRKLDVGGQPFTIIGLLEAKGGSLGGSQDNVVDIPVTTAQQVLNTKDISGMLVDVTNTDQIEAVKAQVQRMLTPRFGDQFSVFTQEQTLGILSTLLGTLTAMLAGLASISLLVGGIGIMNIMLVSVSERTREIGIRKAVGARTYDILSQFVIEAMVLSVLGGVLGILVGAGGALAMQKWVPAQVTFWAVALAFLFSAAVGVFFGVYPAYRASRLDPDRGPAGTSSRNSYGAARSARRSHKETRRLGHLGGSLPWTSSNHCASHSGRWGPTASAAR